MMRQVKLAGVVVLIALALMGGRSKAAIILQLDSVTPVGSTFKYDYSAYLQPDQKINDNGVGLRNAFVTLFDFSGLVSASVTNVNGTWSLSTPLLGKQAFFQNAPDSGSIPNLLVEANTGTVITPPNPGPAVKLFTLSAISTQPTGGLLFQSGQALKNRPGFIPAGNTTLVEGPTVIPEPGSLALAGLVMVFGASMVRRRGKA